MRGIEGLLKVSASSVRELKLQPFTSSGVEHILKGIQGWANQGYPLPSVISVFSADAVRSTSELIKFWLASGSSSKLPSFEIRL